MFTDVSSEIWDQLQTRNKTPKKMCSFLILKSKYTYQFNYNRRERLIKRWIINRTNVFKHNKLWRTPFFFHGVPKITAGGGRNKHTAMNVETPLPRGSAGELLCSKGKTEKKKNKKIKHTSCSKNFQNNFCISSATVYDATNVQRLRAAPMIIWCR